jgi:meiotically up-regulated gene 157 (Mug157) protein
VELNSPAIILDVPNATASSDFLTEHLGFTVAASGDGFTVLGHDGHGLRIIVRPLAAGAARPDDWAVQFGFVVPSADDVWAQLEPVSEVLEPINSSEATKERSFRIADANGVNYLLVEQLT